MSNVDVKQDNVYKRERTLEFLHRSEGNVKGVCQGLCIYVSHQYKSYFIHRKWRLIATRSEFEIRTLFREHNESFSLTFNEKDSLTLKHPRSARQRSTYVQSYNLQSYWSKNESDTYFNIKLTRIQAYQDSLADGCEYLSWAITTRSHKHCLLL